MKEQKNIITRFGEMIDQYLTDRRIGQQIKTSPLQPSRLTRTLRWLTPNGGTLVLIALLIVTQSVWAKPLLSALNAPGASATTVNYQGSLADSGGTPLTGTYAMSFSIYDAPSTGSVIWGPESHPAVQVNEGLFNVGLGSQTVGGIPTTTWNGDRYLEITVGGETLTPRELIRSVPVAGMALTVPDGAITSNSLNLDSGKVCLSAETDVSLPGGYVSVLIPGMSTTFSLTQPSQVIVGINGLAMFDQTAGSSAGEETVILFVDGAKTVGTWSKLVDTWFDVKGQILLDLDSGPHTLDAKAGSARVGTMTIHGVGAWKTCIYYMVLGEQ